MSVLAVLGVVIGLAVLGRADTSRGDPALAADPPRPVATQEAMAPLPTRRPKLVQPVAGRSTKAPGVDDLPIEQPVEEDDLKVTGPASTSKRGEVPATSGVSDLNAKTATALPNGVALPPLEAPKAVLDVIQAGNIIARSPYKWGGGHGNFKDSGYDCSGSVTYALYSAGLISGSATSGQLMGYGKPGPGRWISIYANPGHVYMMVAGIRFDTVARKLTGSRWQNSPVSASGKYEVRHPAGY